MNTASKLFVMGLVAVLTVGCSGMKKKGDADVVDSGMAGTSGAEGAGQFTGRELDDPSSPLYQKVIYFAFDSSEIAAEYQSTLAAHAKYIASYPNISVSLEGHADERGSREYNIGLGDRRAQAVRRVLELNGVGGSQLTTVSYGEEKPAAEGGGEAAWSKNRRVELVYPSR